MGYNLETSSDKMQESTSEQTSCEPAIEYEETSEDYEDCAASEVDESTEIEGETENIEESENYDDCMLESAEVKESGQELSDENEEDYADCGKEQIDNENNKNENIKESEELQENGDIQATENVSDGDETKTEDIKENQGVENVTETEKAKEVEEAQETDTAEEVEEAPRTETGKEGNESESEGVEDTQDAENMAKVDEAKAEEVEDTQDAENVAEADEMESEDVKDDKDTENVTETDETNAEKVEEAPETESAEGVKGAQDVESGEEDAETLLKSVETTDSIKELGGSLEERAENVSVSKLETLQEETDAKQQELQEVCRQTEVETKKLFDKVSVMDRGTEEYKQALREYNESLDKKEMIMSQLKDIEAQQEILKRKGEELQENQLLKGKEDADFAERDGKEQKTTDDADSNVLAKESEKVLDDGINQETTHKLVDENNQKLKCESSVARVEESVVTDAIDNEGSTYNKLFDYMNKHNYGLGDFETYSQDPEWREIQRQINPDFVLPPLTQENAHNQLINYMYEHNYGPGDFETYSQDPKWRELQRAVYPDFEMPPLNREDNVGNWKEISNDNTDPSLLRKINLDATNPNYLKGEEWQINCQRCVPTYEMRARGYDVTALPCIDDNDYLSYHPYDVWEDGDMNARYVSGMEEIQTEMSKWGDGARAQVCVVWKEGDGGHTFMAEQRNGKTCFFDPQTGDSNVSWYFDEAKQGYTSFCRIDQLKPSTRILDCCKEENK